MWFKMCLEKNNYKCSICMFIKLDIRAVKKNIAFRIFVEFKIKIHIRMQNAACDDEVSLHFNAFF